MYKTIKISRGNTGWGGPLVITPTDKCHTVLSVTGGGIDPVSQKIAELTGGEAVDGWKTSLPDEEVPRLLKRILRNTLLNQIQKETIRAKYRQPVIPCHEGEERREEEPITEQYATDSTEEPENRLLQQELSQAVKDAMYSLRPSEHNVLYGLYFEYKTTAELARDMHCTTQNICRLHKNGLRHLRKLLARQLSSPLLSDLKEKLL